MVTKSENELMNPVAPPVRRALIMICEKCGRKLAPSVENNLSRELQQYLKSETTSRWGKGEVRTVVTTCMDICPENKISVAVNHLEMNSQHTEFFEMEPTSLAVMAENILNKLDRK